MNKILDFGRKAMFYVRVLSGYEERRIRSYRLQLQSRLQQFKSGNYLSLDAQEKKAALKKIPEQVILSEVRRMVEEMQALNRKLEETEAAIEDYFKPIDQEAEMIMKIQLEGEEKTMKEMMRAMQKQALLERDEAEKLANVHNTDTDQHSQAKPSTITTSHAEVRRLSEEHPQQ